MKAATNADNKCGDSSHHRLRDELPQGPSGAGVLVRALLKRVPGDGTLLQLSQTTEYALRALAHLSVEGDGKPVRALDLAAATHVPSAYVSKVMRKLVVAGLVDGTKGHHGGFKLARPASGIRFIEVIRAVDPEPAIERCAFGWGACNSAAPCPLHPAFTELSSCLRAWAERTSLADVVSGSVPAERP